MCVSPLKGFQIGVNPSGKPSYKITNYNVHHVEMFKGAWKNIYEDYISPYAVKVVRNFVEIPCGKCLECRLSYARNWANRCIAEGMYYDDKYFLTLTYNDDNLPHSQTGLMTLKKKDLQDFWKRLRDHKGDLRYFACGEYGDSTARPHYHAIVFGLKLDDLVYHGQTDVGSMIYISPSLTEIWKHGFVVVGEVTADSVSYVARYTLKKQQGKTKEFYNYLGIEPEFVVMSRRPGIGYQYFLDHKDTIYNNDEIILSDSKGAIISKPPRYFDSQFEKINETSYLLLKDRRKRIAENQKKLLFLTTNLSYQEILKNRERNLIEKTCILKRDVL